MIRVPAALLVAFVATSLVLGAVAQGESLVQSPRYNGLVQSVDGEHVNLADGRSFRVTAESRINRVHQADRADLQPGQNVGITTQLQSDGSLAVISVHIANPDRPFNAGAVPIVGASDEDVMNNSVIESITDASLTFMLPAGSVTGAFPMDTPVVAFIEPGTTADFHTGAWTSAVVDESGLGQHIYIEYE